MYAVSEISLPRERFESISRMDSHDAELEYSTTGEREGGSTVDLKTGKRFYSSEFLSIPPLLCIFNSIEFIAKYVWTVIRMDGGRNEELSEFLARILSIIFPTLPVSSIRSLLNRLSTRFSRSAARRKRHSVIFF